MSKEFYFTSESVTEGHPDKTCDCISDGILDSDIAREVLNNIGYSSKKAGMNGSDVEIEVKIVEQSPDIARGLSQKSRKDQGAGDQGLMFGFACKETDELMPLPIHLAHELAEKLTEVRKSKELDFLQPDGKTQVTIKYNGFKPVEISKVVIATQHDDLLPKFSGSIKKEQNYIKDSLINYVIEPIVSTYDLKFNNDIIVNGTGRFVKGGPGADTGITGRKIIVDTYGGYARHGGGAFSGKDPSKVDRSAAYMARHVSKQVVASGLAERCELQLAYSIGIAEPVSIFIDTFGTGTIDDYRITDLVSKHFDFRPFNIIEYLNLKRPIYGKLAAYGHLGRQGYPWEDEIENKEFVKAAKENLLWKIA